MSCRPLKSVYFGAYTRPADVLRDLEAQLKELAEISLDTDFEDDAQIDLFDRNVRFIKGYYERYERLVRESVGDIIDVG